jgi:hypothetical protein
MAGFAAETPGWDDITLLTFNPRTIDGVTTWCAV